jgi:L-aminopeptidase/D-esterase-like protein
MLRITKAVMVGLFLHMVCAPLTAEQSKLQPLINAHDRVLELDWPVIHVGTGQYEDGPTGVTVFHFQKKVLVAMDVLGGSPSTVNQAYVDLGYDYPELDAIVFAGGSWYGLEGVTAVSTALKEDGLRDGNAFGDAPNIAMTLGSIIFDFGSRRLNEIFPDQRLAQAAFRAARPGFFPQGEFGAGRMAKSGGFFGCNAHSGQGGAVRKVGELKIAAFAVVNAYGVVTDRQGRTAACYPAPGWPANLQTAELMTEFPASKDEDWQPSDSSREERNSNTTVSLVVVNQKLTAVELKRLAVQVHASMSRAIQPFGTLYDGDALYAVSTAEIESSELSAPEIGVVASETMWDAILASVPQQQPLPVPPTKSVFCADDCQELAGEYRFSDTATLNVRFDAGRLLARASGKVAVFAIGREEEVELQVLAEKEFFVPGRYPLKLQFIESGQLVINPGHWQQRGERVAASPSG